MKYFLFFLSFVFGLVGVSYASPNSTAIHTHTKTVEFVPKQTKFAESKPQKEPKARKRWVAIVLCFFLGVLGVHRFYMGDTVIGLIQLFSGGGGGIWSVIDLIRLCCGGFKSRFK